MIFGSLLQGCKEAIEKGGCVKEWFPYKFVMHILNQGRLNVYA